jgi:hypothetical protein
MVILSGVLGIYNFVYHDHGEEARTGLPYQKIRTKPFPWRECPNCDLFDLKCWKECRDGKKGISSEETHKGH